MRILQTSVFLLWALLSQAVQSAPPVVVNDIQSIGGSEKSGSESARVASVRSNSMYVRPMGEHPLLAVGGQLGETYYGEQSSVEVDALFTDGHSAPVAPLLKAGADAAVRLPNGVIVVSRSDNREMPSEIRFVQWFVNQPGPGKWFEIASAPKHLLALGSDEKGNGLWMDDGTRVLRFRVARAGDKYLFETLEVLPPMNRPREPFRGGGDPPFRIAIRGLADGRVIVAGGSVQSEMVAIATPDLDKPSAKDQYLSVGAYLPSRRHEIFDPASKTWRNSAPSRAVGGSAIILVDGRVAKIGTLTRAPGAIDPALPPIVEISSPDGLSWRSLDSGLPQGITLSDWSRVFEQNEELFLATARGSCAVMWYDIVEMRWKPSWGPDLRVDWTTCFGYLVFVTLPNGKQVVLPLEGY